MLIRSSQFINMPVLSLQTGDQIAQVDRLIVDPSDLTVLAFELSGSRLDQSPSLLRIEDIRELSSIGFIIDSSDECIAPSDVVKIKQV